MTPLTLTASPSRRVGVNFASRAALTAARLQERMTGDGFRRHYVSGFWTEPSDTQDSAIELLCR